MASDSEWFLGEAKDSAVWCAKVARALLGDWQADDCPMFCTELSDIRSAEFLRAGQAIHAVSLPEKKLDELDTISMLMVVRLRHEFKKAKLEKMTGKEIFLHAVKQGMISKSSVKRNDKLGKIEVSGTAAKAYHPRFDSVPMFHFAKDDEGWRLSLSKSFDLGNQAMEGLLKKLDLTRRQFIQQTLKTLSGKEVDPRVFKGPLE